MPDTLNQNPQTARCWLVDFTWGSIGPHTAYYASSKMPVTVGGNTYLCDPQARVKVRPGKQTGGVKDEPWSVYLPATLEPGNYLAREYAFADVLCNIWEVDPTSLSPVATWMWQGKVSQAILNPDGMPNVVQLDIAGWRALIQYPIPPKAGALCANIFGDILCGFNIASVEQTGTISSISNFTIAATGLTIPGGMPSTYWTNGKVFYDGLTIQIRDGSAGAGALVLLKKPPPEWSGVSATFTPGCDKILTSGCTQWSNTARFLGLAVAAPSFDPIIGFRQG